MNRRLPRMAAVLPLVLATSLVACATGATPPAAPQAPGGTAASVAPSAPAAGASTAPKASAAPAAGAALGKTPAAAPPPAVQSEIKKALTRVARPIPDPVAGKSFKASQYWDYELGTPFEIEDTTITGLGDADKDGRVETKIVSDVKLPNGKLQAKLMLLGKYALAQVGGKDQPSDEAEDDMASGDEDEGDAAGDVAETGGGATVGSGDDENVDVDWGFADWEDEIDLAEVDEEISEASDDITWEDDWVVDGDGDGAWEESDEVAYVEDYNEEEEDTFLTAPHRCEMVVQDAPAMSNLDDFVAVTDKDSGETLSISYDQEWTRYTIKTSAGTGEIEYLPDGSYLVDGKPATDEAAVAKLLGDAAWFRVTSRYSLGLVAARLGRLEEDASRAPSCQNGLTYRLASGSPEQISRRSFGLVNALVTAVE